MVLHNLMLHQKGEARWIGFPPREWTDQAGVKQFARFIEFADHTTAGRDQILAALDKHLAGAARS